MLNLLFIYKMLILINWSCLIGMNRINRMNRTSIIIWWSLYSNFEFAHELSNSMTELLIVLARNVASFREGSMKRFDQLLFLLSISHILDDLHEFTLSIFWIHVRVDILHFLSQQESFPIVNLIDLVILKQHSNVLFVNLVVHAIFSTESVSNHYCQTMDVSVRFL